MKSTAIAQPSRLVIGTPPLFVTLCVLMWTLSLVLAFHTQGTAADLGAISSSVAP